MPLSALGENDRHFDDFESLPPEFVRHLDLKTVAIRTDFIEIDGLKRAATKTFIAAGRVAERHSRDERDIFSRKPAQHQPFQRPVHDADAADVTRAEHK